MQQKPALRRSFLFDLEYSNLQVTLAKQVNCCYPVAILSTVWYCLVFQRLALGVFYTVRRCAYNDLPFAVP